MDKFNLFREKYESIIYEKYEIEENEDFVIKYTFKIPGLTTFNPTLTLNKNMFINESINNNLLNSIIFRIGMIELISYYKVVCPKRIIIEAGYLQVVFPDFRRFTRIILRSDQHDAVLSGFQRFLSQFVSIFDKCAGQFGFHV